MEINLKQIRDNKDITEKDGFGVTVIIGFLGTGFFFVLTHFNIDNFIAMVVTFIFVLSIKHIYRKRASDWVKKKDIVGIFSFKDKNISITKNEVLFTIYYDDIIKIDLRYNHIKGNQYAFFDIIHNGLAEIKIKTKQGELNVYKFLIENKEQIKNMAIIFKKLYKKGININESMGKYDVKTVLFDSNYSYQKIQELKRN